MTTMPQLINLKKYYDDNGLYKLLKYIMDISSVIVTTLQEKKISNVIELCDYKEKIDNRAMSWRMELCLDKLVMDDKIELRWVGISKSGIKYELAYVICHDYVDFADEMILLDAIHTKENMFIKSVRLDNPSLMDLHRKQPAKGKARKKK